MIKRIVKFVLKYKYVFLFLAGAIYMIYFDSNSFINQYKLSKELKNLRSQQEFYRNEILKDSLAIEALNDPTGLEKYAREHYYMKRPNEDIFIIIEE